MTGPCAEEGGRLWQDVTALAGRRFDALSAQDYVLLFDWARVAGVPLSACTEGARAGDKGVFQYWNDVPDEQVSRLLAQTRKNCQQDGTHWRLFDEATAIAFLRGAFGERHVAALNRCLHHAQRSDFFRYFYILGRGGMWLDADLALIRPPSLLMRARTPVLFQRRAKVGLLTSWLLIAEAGNALIAEIAEAALNNIENEAFFAERAAKRDIFSISGPKIVCRIAARHIHRALQAGEARPPVTIIDESIHDQFVAKGTVVLGEPLRYKRTSRSWQRWKLADE